MHRRGLLLVLGFLLPLGAWAAVSHVPWIWHPLVELRVPGCSDYQVGDRVPRHAFASLMQEEAAWHTRCAAGELLPAPGAEPLPAGSASRVRRINAKVWERWQLWLDGSTQATPAVVRTRLQEVIASGKTLATEDHARIKVLLALPNDAAGAPMVPDDRILPAPRPVGHPANPVWLPAPEAVAAAMVTAFSAPPARAGDPWLHERLLHSLRVVAQGFGLALLLGLPLGLLAGSFSAIGRLLEPPCNFLGYIPPPAFAALLVGIFGLQDGPKVGMVFIASVFSLVLMTAASVRALDKSVLEAAQTLGADRRALLLRVVLPGSLPRIFADIRVLLAMGWTILIVAEVTGEKSGLSAFMDQQGKYRNYANVYAVMLILGSIGLAVDQILALLQPLFFPWQGRVAPAWLRGLAGAITWLPRWSRAEAEARALMIEQARAELRQAQARRKGDRHE